MTDVHNKKTRSYNMSMIRSKDTPARPAGGKPEIIVRKFLIISLKRKDSYYENKRYNGRGIFNCI